MRVATSVPPSTQGSLHYPSVGSQQVGPLWVLDPHQLSLLAHPHSFQMFTPQRLPSLGDLRAGVLSGHWWWQAGQAQDIVPRPEQPAAFGWLLVVQGCSLLGPETPKFITSTTYVLSLPQGGIAEPTTGEKAECSVS